MIARFSLWVIGIFLPSVLNFNLDYEYTVVKTGPAGSLFGFSVAEHQEGSNNWLLIGAPQGNNTYLQGDTKKSKTSGTVFKCNATDPSFTCAGEVPFDIQDSTTTDSKSNAWLGVSIKSAGKDKSVVSCSHRYEYHGQLSNFRLLEGKCYQVSSTLSGEDEYSPCRSFNDERGVPPDHENYGQCEAGIGLDIYPELRSDELAVLIGAVGSKWFAGRLFERDADQQYQGKVDTDDSFRDSYFGYSIAIGNYYSSSQKAVATGGPRHSSYGKVLIYSTREKRILQQLPKKNEEIQIASGYGIALCSADFDNNMLTELVVGAPFYAFSGEKDQPESGLVYVYHKKGAQNKLSLHKTIGIKKAYSNFGYAVANAGDLNNDGYNDLVVGAPRQDDGAGAVYVFQGSNNGLFGTHSQQIMASSVHSGLTDNIGLKGFGRSLATGLDMDNNGYNDVLVGAYASDQAALLRGRPVIRTYSSMTFEPNEINTTNKSCRINNDFTTCFKIQFCHNISEPSHRLQKTGVSENIEYTIVADPIRNPRVKFMTTDTNKNRFIVKSNKDTKCEEINNLYLVYNKDGYIAEYPDITFVVSIQIPYGKKDVPKPKRSDTKVPSLDHYPVLFQAYKNGEVATTHDIKVQLNFKRECKTCIPDLSLSSGAKNYTLRLGSKTFRFNVTIENKGTDPAYSVGLKINLPEKLEISQVVDVNNNIRECPKDNCENLINKFKKGEKTQFGIILNTRAFGPLSMNNISVIVSSANEEIRNTTKNNKLDITFDIKVDADVELLRTTSTQQILYQGKVKGESAMTSLEDTGQYVEHKYVVRNNGPDLLPIANLTIQWPFETLSGKHLLYLVDIAKTSKKTKCILPNINELKLKSNGSTVKTGSLVGSRSSKSADSNIASKKRLRRDTTASNQTDPVTVTTAVPPVNPTDKELQRKKDGIILDCNKGTAKCFTITCTVESLESQQTVSVSVQSRLWETSLLLDYYGDVLTVVSTAKIEIGTDASYITDPDLENNENELYTVINPEFAKKKKGGIAAWQIALAAIAGVILLALLIFGLWKVGFFKRKRADESKYSKTDGADKSLLSKSKNGH